MALYELILAVAISCIFGAIISILTIVALEKVSPIEVVKTLTGR